MSQKSGKIKINFQKNVRNLHKFIANVFYESYSNLLGLWLIRIEFE